MIKANLKEVAEGAILEMDLSSLWVYKEGTDQKIVFINPYDWIISSGKADTNPDTKRSVQSVHDDSHVIENSINSVMMG